MDILRIILAILAVISVWILYKGITSLDADLFLIGLLASFVFIPLALVVGLSRMDGGNGKNILIH